MIAFSIFIDSFSWFLAMLGLGDFPNYFSLKTSNSIHSSQNLATRPPVGVCTTGGVVFLFSNTSYTTFMTWKYYKMPKPFQKHPYLCQMWTSKEDDHLSVEPLYRSHWSVCHRKLCQSNLFLCLLFSDRNRMILILQIVFC